MWENVWWLNFCFKSTIVVATFLLPFGALFEVDRDSLLDINPDMPILLFSADFRLFHT